MKRILHKRSSIAATTALATVLAVGGLTPALAEGSGAQHRQGAQNQQLQPSQAQSGTQNQQHVRAVQEKLIDEGYDVGAADGQWGPKTSSAVRQFQQAEGIQPSGQIDRQTLEKLGVAAMSPSDQRGDEG